MPENETALVPSCGHPALEPRHAAAPCAIDVAALARLNFAAGQQALAIPHLRGVPASYHHMSHREAAQTIAEDVAWFGLGSLPLWRKHDGNLPGFILEAMQQWLDERGAAELREAADHGLFISDTIEEESSGETVGGSMVYFQVEARACGVLLLGAALAALERECAGLGTAFYDVLLGAIHRWGVSYSACEVEMYTDQWRESIEMDMQRENDLTLTVEQYCKREDIHLPDLEGGIPACVQRRQTTAHSFALLRKHRDGPYREWIGMLLEASRQKPRHLLEGRMDGLEWDDGPLPSWLVAFENSDCVFQAFDQESQSMYECSHQPCCLWRYRPGDRQALRGVLRDLAGFMAFNTAVAGLGALIDQWRKQNANRPAVRGFHKLCA